MLLKKLIEVLFTIKYYKYTYNYFVKKMLNISTMSCILLSFIYIFV